MPYTRPYSGGFVDYPATTTPINSTALNTMDVGIKTANDQFQTVTTTERTALTPTVGQCVWDSTLKQLMVYMNASGGNAWQPIGNRIICTSTTRPATPFHGQVIYETDTKREYVYNGTAWVQTNSASTTSGVTGVNNLIVPPSAGVYNTGNVSVANVTWTRLSFTTAAWDTDTIKGAGTDTGLTINTTGLYTVAISAAFDTNTTGVNREILIDKGTSSSLSTVLAAASLTWGANGYADLNASIVAPLTAGDTIQAFVFQNSGGALNVLGAATRIFSATWIGRTS